MKICQWIIFVLFVVSLLTNLHYDVNGRKAKEAPGFKGIVVTLLVMALMFFLYWKAGAWSMILGGGQ